MASAFENRLRRTIEMAGTDGQAGPVPVMATPSGSGLERPLGSAGLSAGSLQFPASGHGQRLMNKLYAGAADAGVLIGGDSTGNQTPVDPLSPEGEWPFRLAQWLAAKFPAYTVLIRTWDTVSDTDYGAAVVIQTGTGTRTLTIWNASVSGSKPDYILGHRYEKAVNALPVVDLLIVNYGHNMYGGEAVDLIGMHYLELTETVLLSHPGIGVVIIGQNPEMETTDNDIKAVAARDVCAIRGFGFADVWSEFTKRGKAASLYVTTDTPGDTKHPSVGIGTDAAPTGTDLFLGRVVAHLDGARVNPETCVSLLADIKAGGNLLLNGDFSAFSSALPDSWTATGATVTKDATVPFGANGYSVKVVNAGAAQAYIDQMLASDVRDKYKGQTLILIVAVYVPSGLGAATATAGRPAILSTSNSANNYTTGTEGLGAWRWKFLLAKTASTDTYIRARLYGNTASEAGAAAYFGAAYLRPGRIPPGKVPAAAVG